MIVISTCLSDSVGGFCQYFLPNSTPVSPETPTAYLRTISLPNMAIVRLFIGRSLFRFSPHALQVNFWYSLIIYRPQLLASISLPIYYFLFFDLSIYNSFNADLKTAERTAPLSLCLDAAVRWFGFQHIPHKLWNWKALLTKLREGKTNHFCHSFVSSVHRSWNNLVKLYKNEQRETQGAELVDSVCYSHPSGSWNYHQIYFCTDGFCIEVFIPSLCWSPLFLFS